MQILLSLLLPVIVKKHAGEAEGVLYLPCSGCEHALVLSKFVLAVRRWLVCAAFLAVMRVAEKAMKRRKS